MSKADSIRALNAEGLSVAEIAARLGIRYQHAYNVLKRRQLQKKKSNPEPREVALKPKPKLTVDLLIAKGFVHSGVWTVMEDEKLPVFTDLSKVQGVYAFVLDGSAVYVGLASMGIRKRLRFYARPGKTQRTSLRINQIIRNEISVGRSVSLYTITPPDLDWNGLPINGSAGLEMGLIKAFDLPWNIRSAKG